MKTELRYKNMLKEKKSTMQKELVDFTGYQFRSLLKKNLGVPVKIFRL